VPQRALAAVEGAFELVPCLGEELAHHSLKLGVVIDDEQGELLGSFGDFHFVHFSYVHADRPTVPSLAIP
jgi:hypothetical protein